MPSPTARYSPLANVDSTHDSNGKRHSIASTASSTAFSTSTSTSSSSNASPLSKSHAARHNARFSTLLARTGVVGATAFVFICLVLSLLPPSATRSGAAASLNKGLSPERRRDRTMDEATCKAEFPLLFPQLADNAAAWRVKGGISYSDVEEAARTCVGNWGMARVVIRDGQLYLREVREGGESRISALLHLLHTAITTDPSSSSALLGASHNVSDGHGIELVLSEADKDASPTSDAVWVLSKRLSEPASKGTWLLPDFGFAGWPEAGIASFDEFLHLAQLQDHLVPWQQKPDKILWRGLANGYPPRVDLLAKSDPRKVRGAEKWADVKQTSFHDVGEEFHPLIPMHEHCRHKFLIQTEGNSYSGRGKYLWACRSVTVAHKLEWTQHFHPALISDPMNRGQNFIELPGPLFDGLEETTLHLQSTADIPVSQDLRLNTTTLNGGAGIGGVGLNPPQRIADNAVETLRHRYLTPAATNCYLRAALKAYSQVLNRDSWPRGENVAAWDQGGVGILPKGGPGGGVAPGGGKGRDLVKVGVKGDIEYGIWRLSGAPDWPPKSS